MTLKNVDSSPSVALGADYFFMRLRFGAFPGFVFKRVLSLGEYLKIFDSVIYFVVVPVMDYFRRKEFSAKMFFHNPTMFKDIMFGSDELQSVPRRAYRISALPSRMFLSLTRKAHSVLRCFGEFIFAFVELAPRDSHLSIVPESEKEANLILVY